METWKSIKFTEGKYEISSHGRVRRVVGGQGVKKIGAIRASHVGKTNGGYIQVRICERTCLIHQLVAEAFIGPRPTPKHTVNHKDGNKLNNRTTNLEWATRSQNIRHAFKLNLKKPMKGSQNGRAQIDEQAAKNIFLLQDKFDQSAIAKSYGIDVQIVQRIHQRVTWRHVTKDL